jgi:hypothetical protein
MLGLVRARQVLLPAGSSDLYCSTSLCCDPSTLPSPLEAFHRSDWPRRLAREAVTGFDGCAGGGTFHLRKTALSRRTGLDEQIGDHALVHVLDSFLTGASTSHHRRLCVKVDRGILPRLSLLIR